MNQSDKKSIYNTIQLSNDELQKISRLIYQWAGIVLTEQKRDMVYNRLSRRLRDLNFSSFSQYIEYMECNPHSEEYQHFVNALTTNLTSFFREAYQFPILARHASERKGSYSVWCTAASTGEEPCSIAMTLNETLGHSVGPRVWATDINTEVLQKASKSIYRLSDLGNLSTEQKKKWFLRGTGSQKHLVKVKRELLAGIHYQQLNLLDSVWDIPGPFDAIFCRNVMIYFDQKTQELLMKRFAKMLKPGGLLFTGHSEHFGNMASPFRLRGQSVYALAQEAQ
ncbi:chemotaxis protein CheR [Leclercia adecarboxylata]|nr:chemotaxis protein CheR [Leclercia adecarboxylata]KMN61786.1 chemotaxis protein CheR [Leclercia sp. LK8]